MLKSIKSLYYLSFRWYIAHDSIRNELDEFKSALEATIERNEIPKDWEVASIQRWWRSHYDHIHSHHLNEDIKLNPFLRQRIVYPEKLEADHVVLVDHMKTIGNLVDSLSETGTSLVDLSSAWKDYMNMMKPHLLEEEYYGIPLMRAYFKEQEIGKIVAEIVGSKTAPREEMGAFIYFLGETKFRDEFMKEHGIPFFVWWLDFKGKFEYYKTEVMPQLEALKAGSPPPPPPPKSSNMAPLLGIAGIALGLGMYFLRKNSV